MTLLLFGKNSPSALTILIPIRTGDNILNQYVNVDNALGLGKKQQEEFEAAWPDGFYKPFQQVVVPMTANRPSMLVVRGEQTHVSSMPEHLLSMPANEREPHQ